MSNRFNHPATQKINQALTEIEQGELHLQQALQDLPSQIGNNDELRLAIINHLYWHERRIPVVSIAYAFGIDINKNIGKLVGYAVISRTCKTCNQKFEVTATSRANLKVIEKGSAYSEPYELCQTCGKEIERKRAEHDNQYRQVYQEQQSIRQKHLEHLRTMPYREYLQTPEWQERRKRAMKRAGYHCQVCNAYGKRLNTHHKTYERRGNEYDRDLIVLCEDCHTIFHENGSLANED